MSYLLGVSLAVASGISNNVGTLIQKKVVNEVPPEARDERFMRTLVRNPMWMFGMILQLGIGTVFFMFATNYIGPALVPGLMAAGLIVLAVGSIKLIHESIRTPEAVGITLMIVAIIFIGASSLVVDASTFNFLAPDFLLRISVFTVILFALIVMLIVSERHSARFKAVSLALLSGVMFALSNYWISPLMGTIGHVLGGTFVLPELVLFSFAAVTLVLDNVFGISTLQTAFKSGQASILVPIQQVPIQVTPALVYFFVFARAPPNQFSFMLLLIGIAAVVVSSFLLGRRQVMMGAASAQPKSEP
jgi:multidrug transporter EmrE-like cation transporter